MVYRILLLGVALDYFVFAQTQIFPDKIYDPFIHSIFLGNSDFQLSLPIIKLNSDDKLLLEFDDLNANLRTFYYTFILCDLKWNPVNKLPQEYLSGPIEHQIPPGKYSFNTRIPYVHYSTVIPDNSTKLLLPGNYLLVVWCEYQGIRSLAFTRRIFVYDNKVSISANVINNYPYNNKIWQKVNFQINTNDLNIPNPSSNIFVVILQNNDWNRAIFVDHQPHIKGNLLDYSKEYHNLFLGGNEFRQLNLKSLRNVSHEIIDVQVINDIYNVFLASDKPRIFERYVHQRDINGRCIFKTDDRTNSATEAEYVYVHFTLLADAPRTDGKLYLYGQLTNWNINEQTEMVYNYHRKAYEKKLLLKQGYYNYQYAFVENQTNQITLTEFEGNYGFTENEYSIWVYVRLPAQDYDQLLGILFLSNIN